MKTLIAHEAGEFLKATGLSARKLALTAGINPVTLTRVLSGARKDMSSSNADAIRSAMARLTTTPPTSSAPAEADAVPPGGPHLPVLESLPATPCATPGV